MKSCFLFVFLMISVTIFSQKKISKQFETNANEINIYTAGLDDITLESSDSNFVEVYLYAEDYDEQLIKIDDKTTSLNINFEFKGTQTREVFFRKFITKRLQRANAIVKIPKGKKVYVFGENVDIASKDFNNELAIYIENGIVKLNKILTNVTLKLYSGNVFASTKNTDVDVKSTTGKIKVDEVLKGNKYRTPQNVFTKKLVITTIKGNLFLTTQSFY